MPWKPPKTNPNVPLRKHLTEEGWRVAIAQIAQKHSLLPCELSPCASGETIVWRAGEYVIKLTTPECTYQIDAEVGCLRATEGKLSVATPQLCAHGKLAGWPYVVMGCIEGRSLAEVWPRLEHRDRRRLAHELGSLCRELHSLPMEGFPGGWASFWETVSCNVGARHMACGSPSPLLASIDTFLEKAGPLMDAQRVPLHTELTDQHVYVQPVAGRFELSALIDFADARIGAPHYEFGALVEFVFKGERGLLREFMLAYGVPEADLTPAYSEVLLGWSLCHQFGNLSRTLAELGPPAPSSLEQLAMRLYSLTAP